MAMQGSSYIEGVLIQWGGVLLLPSSLAGQAVSYYLKNWIPALSVKKTVTYFGRTFAKHSL
jgi:hypothetical protein